MAAAGQLTPTIAAKGNKYYSLRPRDKLLIINNEVQKEVAKLEKAITERWQPQVNYHQQ